MNDKLHRRCSDITQTHAQQKGRDCTVCTVSWCTCAVASCVQWVQEVCCCCCTHLYERHPVRLSSPYSARSSSNQNRQTSPLRLSIQMHFLKFSNILRKGSANRTGNLFAKAPWHTKKVKSSLLKPESHLEGPTWAFYIGILAVCMLASPSMHVPVEDAINGCVWFASLNMIALWM